MTHICVIKLTIIGSDNGLSPVRRQAIIWTNAGILLIRPLGTNFSEILIEIHTFSFKKMHLKLSSAKLRPFCLGLDVLTWINSYCEKEWGDSSMMFASDTVTQLANRLTRDNKSVFTVRHIFFCLLYIISWFELRQTRCQQTYIAQFVIVAYSNSVLGCHKNTRHCYCNATLANSPCIRKLMQSSFEQIS